MSFTDTVSALSKAGRIDGKALRQALGIPETAQTYMYNAEQAAAFVRYASPAQVMQWWEATEAAHATQLNQKVRWDETSDFVEIRDFYAGQNLDLRYVAAYLDKFAEETLAAGFAARPRDRLELDRELDAWTKYRGFASRFPQIITEGEYCLPFAANLVLSVPDWTGKQAEFGSLPRILEEYEKTSNVIAKADPMAKAAGMVDRKHENLLAGVYNAARLHRDLTRVAIHKNLPLWFSE